MKQQTAVEWLEEIYITKGIDRNVHFNQAKAIYKQQIIDAYRKGFMSDDIKLADDYYNENFNKETI